MVVLKHTRELVSESVSVSGRMTSIRVPPFALLEAFAEEHALSSLTILTSPDVDKFTLLKFFKASRYAENAMINVAKMNNAV